MNRGARILVVDDEAPNRRLVRTVLEPLGFRLQEAADGEEALAALQGPLPDLILLDVTMPGRDGCAVCRRIKDDPRTRMVPVILLTALDQLDDRVRGIDSGADDYLTKPFHVQELTARIRSLLSLKRYTDELEHAGTVIEGLARTLEIRDAYTGDHGKRVGDMAARIGEAMGVPEEGRRTLRLGGILHDLGKIAVPDAVLRKPGRLTESEACEMRTHAHVGSDLCRPMRTMEEVVPIIRHHHERLDGSGYPDGLRGEEIPLLVRIISVADIHDALATKRPYKEAFPRERCLAILREEAAKGWWDRDVVETLARITDGG